MLSERDIFIKDLKNLVQIFFELVQSSVDEFKGGEKWKGFAHALTLKFYRHVYALADMFPPRTDLITGDRYIDIASIKVLERAMFENFVIFFHLYAEKDEAVGKMNFDLWMCCGLMARQRFDADTMEYADQSENERVEIEGLWKSLNGSTLYLDTYSKAQRNRLEKGEWSAIHKMGELAEKAKVQYYYKKMYKHNSGFAHAGFLGALQVNQARSLEHQSQLSMASLGMTIVITTHFISTFASMSKDVEKKLNLNPVAKKIFSTWFIQDSDWQRVFKPKV